MSLSVGQILARLNDKAPVTTAESWDNVGLLVGDPAWKPKGAVICQDLTREALEAAKAPDFGLIVLHHPCIFPKERGRSRLTPGRTDQDLDTLMFEAIQNRVAIIAVHTNFDQCALEVVEKVSAGLGVKPLGRLHDPASLKGPNQLIKLSVFVPETHIESVRTAICEAGAGQIGQYDFCTFGTSGEGTFRGLEGTDPFIGKPGQLESAKEIKLETILPRSLTRKVTEALLKAHPYEEVAYDLFPLLNEPSRKGQVSGLGYGFWGDFETKISFKDLSERVKRLFNIDGYWLTEPAPVSVQRVAFAAGKGASFLKAASSAGCDLFITGEVGYHGALDGSRQGISVMEIGHRESEYFFLEVMEIWLSGWGLGTRKLNSATQKIYKETRA